MSHHPMTNTSSLKIAAAYSSPLQRPRTESSLDHVQQLYHQGHKKHFFPAKITVFCEVTYYQTSGYRILDCVVRRKLKTILICEMPFFSAVSEKFSEQLSPKELHLKILQFFSYMNCAWLVLHVQIVHRPLS
jgi:hypothetical protein